MIAVIVAASIAVGGTVGGSLYFNHARKRTSEAAAQQNTTVESAVESTASEQDALVNHFIYRDIQIDDCDVEEYAFYKDGVFERKSLLIRDSVSVTNTEKGTYAVCGDEVILYFEDKTYEGGYERKDMHFIFYNTGENEYVCDVSYDEQNDTFRARKLYYSSDKIKDADLPSFMDTLPYSNVVDFKQKTTYYSYEAVIDFYTYAKRKHGHASVYYNYTTLKTPYGSQEVLVITPFMSAYIEKTLIFTKDKNGVVENILEAFGKMTRISKDMNTLLTSYYYGSGMGEYYLLEYDSDTGKYKEAEKYPFEMQTRSDVQNQMEELTKDFSQFVFDKNEI